MNTVVPIIQRCDRDDRPVCPACKCRMTVAKVTPLQDREQWQYRCSGCGCSATITLEAIA